MVKRLISDQKLDGAVQSFADLPSFSVQFETGEDLSSNREQSFPGEFDLFYVARDDVSNGREEGDEAGEGFGDAPEVGLGAAAGGVVGGERVEAVLEDIEVESAEVGVGEL